MWADSKMAKAMAKEAQNAVRMCADFPKSWGKPQKATKST
jgi:hypothetical protein